MIRTAIFALAALAAAPAFAASEKVRYVKAHLDDPAEVAALYADIEAAALKVCRIERLSDYSNYSMKACVAHAIRKAVEDVDSPALAAYASGAPETRIAANE